MIDRKAEILLKNLNKIKTFAPIEQSILIYSGEHSYNYRNTRIVSYKEIAPELKKIFNS